MEKNQEEKINLLGFEFDDAEISLHDYLRDSRTTVIYPENGRGTVKAVNYCVLGLSGEAGELANHFKKALRDDNEDISYERWKDLVGELGDILWYWSQLCLELGVIPDHVARMNLEKLKSRQERDQLKGSGDNR